MKIRTIAMSVAGLFTAGLFSATASAGIVVIDDFSTVDAAWPASLSAPGSVSVDETGLATLGGTRSTTLEATSVGVPGIDFVQAAIAAGAGLLDYNSTVDTDGHLTLLYDGGGALNADFSALNSIALAFTMFDHAGGAPLDVTIELSDGVNSATHTLSLVSPGAQALSFSFGDFAGIGALNLGSVQSIEIDIDPAIGADFRITEIMAVPAPAGLALLSIAFAAPRRRRD